MAAPLTAPQVLNREFLEMRSKILDLAAALDRLERASETVVDDPRMAKLYEALDVLSDDKGDRAELVQLIFSRPYDDDWQQNFALNAR